MQESQEFQKRQVAHKVFVTDVLGARYVKQEGFAPNYVEIRGRQVARVNIIGIVVQKTKEENHTMVLVDDGTGRISARAFDADFVVEGFDIGDVVLVVGKPREYASEKYLLMEMIKKVDNAWAHVRNAELRNVKTDVAFQSVPQDTRSSSQIRTEPVSKPGSGGPALEETNALLKAIKEKDSGDGVAVEDLSSVVGSEKLVEFHLKQGDIFEIKPGRVKVLE